MITYTRVFYNHNQTIFVQVCHSYTQLKQRLHKFFVAVPSDSSSGPRDGFLIDFSHAHVKTKNKPSPYIGHVGYMFKQFIELLVRIICKIKTNFKVCSKCLVT